MCHHFLSDPSFYKYLFHIDQDIAANVQAAGCSCGGVLHSACYPRKPRGVRQALDETYDYRLSFCCANDDCRRRTTPPSVRFLGRKVYLGVIVILISAMQHGLSVKRRERLIEQLDVPSQTLYRWRQWWQKIFPTTRCWQAERGHYVPPITAGELPDELLGRLAGKDLMTRLCRLLLLVAPVTTSSWSGYLRISLNPQKM